MRNGIWIPFAWYSWSGIYYFNEVSLFPWWQPQASSRQKFMPIRLCGSPLSRNVTRHHIRLFFNSQSGIKALANPWCSSQTVKDFKLNITQLGLNNKIMLPKGGFTNLRLISSQNKRVSCIQKFINFNIHCKVINCNETTKHLQDLPLSRSGLPQI